MQTEPADPSEHASADSRDARSRSQESGHLVLPLRIEGVISSLRPINRGDFKILFDWSRDRSELHPLALPAEAVSADVFAELLERRLRQTITFLAFGDGWPQPFGYLQAWDLSLSNGWCFAGSYFEGVDFRSSWALDCKVSFFDYLFVTFGLRKLYWDVDERSFGRWRPLLAGGFDIEGRFRRHVLLDQEQSDVVRLALYRERWTELRDRIRMIVAVEMDAAELIAAQCAQLDGASARGDRPCL